MLAHLTLAHFRKTTLCSLFALLIGATTPAIAGNGDILVVVIRNSNPRIPAVLIEEDGTNNRSCTPIESPTRRNTRATTNGPVGLRTNTSYSAIAMATVDCRPGTGIAGMYASFRVDYHGLDSQQIFLNIYKDSFYFTSN